MAFDDREDESDEDDLDENDSDRDEDEPDEDDLYNLLDPNDADDVRLVRQALAGERASRPSKGLGHTLALLLISLFLFWTLESASTDGTGTWVAALVLVLAVHEAGHLVAMRAFGFTDLKVFFIPFFGAAASGRKIDATPTQRALVSLMGPLPGIALGFVATFLGPHDSRFLSDVVVLALAINALNLLPIVPLDGGHFLHQTLFARWPLARRIVAPLNVIALVGVGLWLQSWILIGLGLFLVGGIEDIRLDDASAELRDHLETGEEQSLSVPDRLVPIGMAIANRRRFASTTRPVEATTYASAILRMWTQLHRAAPIPAHRTIALLTAYVGTIALVPAALLRLVP